MINKNTTYLYMIKLIYECDKLIAELSKFSPDMLYLGPSINDDRLELFEKQIGFELPFDFQNLYLYRLEYSLSW